MRCFQLMGLTPEAENFLSVNCATEPDMNSLCPHCGKPTKEQRIVLGVKHVESFYTDGPDLHTYKLKDGRIIKEIIQAEPWSSGPVSFLCLELEDGTRIGEWSQEEIDNV